MPMNQRSQLRRRLGRILTEDQPWQGPRDVFISFSHSRVAGGRSSSRNRSSAGIRSTNTGSDTLNSDTSENSPKVIQLSSIAGSNLRLSKLSLSNGAGAGSNIINLYRNQHPAEASSVVQSDKNQRLYGFSSGEVRVKNLLSDPEVAGTHVANHPRVSGFLQSSLPQSKPELTLSSDEAARNFYSDFSHVVSNWNRQTPEQRLAALDYLVEKTLQRSGAVYPLHMQTAEQLGQIGLMKKDRLARFDAQSWSIMIRPDLFNNKLIGRGKNIIDTILNDREIARLGEAIFTECRRAEQVWLCMRSVDVSELKNVQPELRAIIRIAQDYRIDSADERVPFCAKIWNSLKSDKSAGGFYHLVNHDTEVATPSGLWSLRHIPYFQAHISDARAVGKPLGKTLRQKDIWYEYSDGETTGLEFVVGIKAFLNFFGLKMEEEVPPTSTEKLKPEEATVNRNDDSGLASLQQQ